MGGRSLPGPVAGHLERVLSDRAETPSRIRLTQTGEMVRRPGERPLGFTAVEDLEVGAVGFEWRAAFGPNRLVRLSVVDRYRDGEGLLTARVWGLIPVTRSSGPEADRSEAMRYLSELPGVPHAIGAPSRLSWRELDGGLVEVSTLVGGSAVSVRLSLDGAGLISGVSGTRPRLAGKRFIETPFVGSFGEYAELGGIRVPRSAEVSWELAEGPFTYWRGEVASLEAI